MPSVAPATRSAPDGHPIADGSAILPSVRKRVSSAGEAIRRTRIARGLSQRALAGDRYTPQYISVLETGRVRPSEKALIYIADRLGVTPGSLLDGAAQPKYAVDPARLLAAERALDEAAQALRQLRESLAATPAASAAETVPTASHSGGQSTGSKGQRRSARQPPLHDAVSEVLRRAGTPLSAAEIAARVTATGWSPPRSGHELRAEQIQARTGHPHYRPRFARRDGRIGLAEWER
jgi:transcriptional regulator with XRE-family HTH domain